MKAIELLKSILSLLAVCGWLVSGHAFGEERKSTPSTTVPEADLQAFIQKWAIYRPFEYPADAKDEPLLLAALKKDPTGPWIAYLGLKFATVKNVAHKLPPPERSRKYGDALTYLAPARETLKQATETQSTDEIIRDSLHELELATALASLEAGRDLAATKQRLQSLLAVSSPKDGNLVNGANSTLGRIALREGDVDDAKRRLLAAGKTSGSPQLHSFGPDFILARELLEKNEQATVLEFLDAVERFWANPKDHSEANAKRSAEYNLGLLQTWRKEIREGKVPNARQWQ